MSNLCEQPLHLPIQVPTFKNSTITDLFAFLSEDASLTVNRKNRASHALDVITREAIANELASPCTFKDN